MLFLAGGSMSLPCPPAESNWQTYFKTRQIVEINVYDGSSYLLSLLLLLLFNLECILWSLWTLDFCSVPTLFLLKTKRYFYSYPIITYNDYHCSTLGNPFTHKCSYPSLVRSRLEYMLLIQSETLMLLVILIRLNSFKINPFALSALYLGLKVLPILIKAMFKLFKP